MATVEVLPPSGTSSRKKEHLEAGKRRLEEFRKKKAADRAKKATASSQPFSSEPVLHQKQTSEAENVRLTNSVGVGTSDGAAVAALSDSSSVIVSDEIKSNGYQHKSNSDSSYETYGGHPFSKNNNFEPSVDKLQTHANNVAFHAYDNFNFQETVNNDKHDVFHYNNGTSFVGHLTSGNSRSPWSTESGSSGFSQPNNVKRTRPSFLDSISTSSVSSVSFPLTKTENADSFSSKADPNDIGDHLNSTNSQATTSGGNDLFRHGINGYNVERNNNFHSQKEDEDFAALEQHIEDLTQEKFSLQRALEASRALAESLAAENSTLTDSYNQQGSTVQQLKLDMEMLQEEIKAQMVELESVKIEYTNAHMECSAADERAKLLASEVIGLEEKALRLRSSELKLERHLENLQSEVSSSKKRISSLEKERKDLQLTIDAMQEEKKMLQSMLRKASANGKPVDVSKNSNKKKDASTSTQDLQSGDRNAASDSSNLETGSSLLTNESDGSRYLSQPENTNVNIPPDQLRMVQNINTLISELSLEKEELMQALSTKSSQSSKLKELNEELSRKLEVQTQRLELLTAQTMVNGNIPPPTQSDSRPVHDHDNNLAYADEGDEVVERVLGWIMKLFPGGPSKRRTSKLI